MTSPMLIIIWSLMSSSVTTVTDCGTSRSGVGVLVALTVDGTT